MQRDFTKIGAELDKVHQNMFLTKCYYVHILDVRVKLQESILAYYSDPWNQIAFQAFMSHFAEVAEDHSEAFKDVILMTNVQFNCGDVLVVESGADLIGLWSTLKMFGRIRLDSRRNSEVEFSSVPKVQSELTNRLVSFYLAGMYDLIFLFGRILSKFMTWRSVIGEFQMQIQI